MIDKNIDEFIRGLKKLNTPQEFIPDAAKKAGYITCATHPSQFSHPYANQDKNFKITPIVFSGSASADGYVRSGNVRTEHGLDMYGSAGFATVMKFLSLTMGNGKTVLENIRDNTPEAKELLATSGQNADELREQFLEVFKNKGKEQITSSKIKQVYFPLGNGDYHLLSLLTPSPMVYELKNRITAINEDAKQKKGLLKKKESAEPFKEIYNLIRLKYGGTQPQNISQLNTENGGITRLLPGAPPSLDDLRIRLPKRNFFAECLNRRAFRWQFESLHKLVSLKDSPIPLEKQRKWRDRLLGEIVSDIVERMFAVREALREIPPELNPEQKIWLNKDESVRSEAQEGWTDSIAEAMAGWIMSTYKRLFKEKSVVMGDAEFTAIKETVSSFEELWK